MAERTARFGHWRINAVERTISWSEGIARIFGRNAALDAQGNIALPFNTPGMYRGWIGADGRRGVAIFGDE